MKSLSQKLLTGLILVAAAIHAQAADDTVFLDETGVRNLKLETATAGEKVFDETTFALGRIEIPPSQSGVVSSRIAGRTAQLLVIPGDTVEMGQTVVQIESRQPGDPPPVIAVKAPLSGLVMDVKTKIGDPVEPDRVLVEIADLSTVFAVARVPENLAGQMAPGTDAHIHLAALPHAHLDGKLLRFGTRVDETSGTLDAIFSLKNEDNSLRPGMRTEFAIVLGRRENVLQVPREALQGDSSNRFLYVKHFEIPNAFLRVPVEVGAMNDRYVEILSGIFPGDAVVTRGAYSLSFVGKGSGLSLMEALDAAHGHEHAEDGSELTPEKRADANKKKSTASASGDAHDHDHAHEDDHDHGEESIAGNLDGLWRFVSGVLFLLLIASFFGRKHRPLTEESDQETERENPGADDMGAAHPPKKA